MDQVLIDNLNADKIALDQMLMTSIKEVHEGKKQIILLNANLQNMINIVNDKNKEIEDLKKELEAAKESQLHIIALESNQSGPLEECNSDDESLFIPPVYPTE